MSVCVCGHDRETHRHYRPGTDCALCGDCGRYRPRWRRLAGDLTLTGLALAGILAAILLAGHIPPGG